MTRSRSALDPNPARVRTPEVDTGAMMIAAIFLGLMMWDALLRLTWPLRSLLSRLLQASTRERARRRLDARPHQQA